MAISYRKLIGAEVVSADGATIGEVIGFEVDDKWAIAALEVELLRVVLAQLGLRRPIFGDRTVHIKTSAIAGMKDVVLLRETLDDLKKTHTDAVPEPFQFKPWEHEE